jgi:CubicO group peptidase (beta-lactamase class C family)
VTSGGVTATYEIYGRLNGSQVPIWKELSFDGIAFHIKQGGRILISHSSSEGYGFGGMPGSWPNLYGNRSPTDWGLDPDKGVVAFDGTRGYAVPATQLVEIFGSGWRQTVYA